MHLSKAPSRFPESWPSRADTPRNCCSKNVELPLPSAPFFMKEAECQHFSSCLQQSVPEAKSCVSVVKTWGSLRCLPPSYSGKSLCPGHSR